MKFPGRSLAVLIAFVTGAALALVGALAVHAGETAPTPKLTNLAQTKAPRGAPGRELTLTRVDIPAGAKLPPHRHLGTQIARIARGTLTYTVIRGSVTVRAGAADGSSRVVRRIRAGQTAKIRTGQWIVEQPHVHHYGQNTGNGPVVILMATLFPKGAPPSVPVPAGR